LGEAAPPNWAELLWKFNFAVRVDWDLAITDAAVFFANLSFDKDAPIASNAAMI
jgi:hypothetical protein